MDRDALRATQAQLRKRYEAEPLAARYVLRAEASVEGAVPVATVTGASGPVVAGLHRAAGGDGTLACAGDLMLQSLVACTAVSLGAIAMGMQLPLRRAVVRAEGDVDFRGALGVPGTPAGFTAIRMSFDLDTDAPPERVERLIAMTERYCAVGQTLRAGVPVTVVRA